MTMTILTTTLVLALGLSASGASAQSRTDLSAGNNQSEVGLLLPAVQAAREAPRPSSSASDNDSDILVEEWRAFFRFLAPRE